MRIRAQRAASATDRLETPMSDIVFLALGLGAVALLALYMRGLCRL